MEGEGSEEREKRAGGSGVIEAVAGWGEKEEGGWGKNGAEGREKGEGLGEQQERGVEGE